MRVVMVAVYLATMADVAFETMHGELRAAEAAGFVGFLDAVDGEFSGGVLRGVDLARLREIQAAVNLARLELLSSHVIRLRAARIKKGFYASGQGIDRRKLRRSLADWAASSSVSNRSAGSGCSFALAGLGGHGGTGYLGLQPRLSHCGPSALKTIGKVGPGRDLAG